MIGLKRSLGTIKAGHKGSKTIQGARSAAPCAVFRPELHPFGHFANTTSLAKI
jgi:hypothetical protein